MKNLSDKIKNLSAQQIQELKKALQIKDSGKSIAGTFYSHFVSYRGMSLIISGLSSDERNILNLVYREKNGVTFSELEKYLKLDTAKIEECADELSKKLLVYILKNRQKLSNKLDKIHMVPEIRPVLSLMDNDSIHNYFRDINKVIGAGDISKFKNLKEMVKTPDIIEFIFENGGIITLEEFFDHAPLKFSEKNLLDMIKNKQIHILHDLIYSGRTLVFLDKKIFITMALEGKSSFKTHADISNRYNLLLNLLKCYDAVSTYGLFLTRQKEFRKVDRKHLDDSMIKIVNIDGSELRRETVSQLSLYLLYIMDCAGIKDDSVIIQLKKIKDFLNDPFEWLLNILKLLQGAPVGEPLLSPPFEVPIYKDLAHIIEIMCKNDNASYKTIETSYFVDSVLKLSGDQIINLKQIRQTIKDNFQTCIKFLCLTGIFDIEKNMLKLSDIGIKVSEKLGMTGPQDSTAAQKDIKKLYLNSDFTLLIPKKEIPSNALYHILTHTEIIKDDVILHTRISRESILTSVKRGMGNDSFFSTLKMYLKTEIPENLNFLISEWLTQAIRLNIIKVTMMNTNQPSFFDKISHSKIKNSIVKRISPYYAIIDRKYMDKLIKMAKENDAVINLFDDSEVFD